MLPCWGEWYCRVLGVPAVVRDKFTPRKLCVGDEVIVLEQDGPHLSLCAGHDPSSKVFARLVAPCATSTLTSLIALHLDGKFEVHADVIEVKACSAPEPLNFGLGTHVQMACDDELNTGKVVALNPLRPEPYQVEYRDTNDLNRTNPEWLSFECPRQGDAEHSSVQGRWRQGTEPPEACELSHITPTVPQLCHAVLLRFSVRTELIPLVTQLDVRFRAHFVTVFSNLQQPAPLLPPAQLSEYARRMLDRDTEPKGLQRVYDRMRPCTRRSQPATAADVDAVAAAAAIASKFRAAVGLVSLPAEMIQLTCSWLHAASLDAFGCTCRTTQRASRGVVPGLRLKLFSHQLEALRWMRWREYARGTQDKGTTRAGSVALTSMHHDPKKLAETVWRATFRARDDQNEGNATETPTAAVDLLTLDVLPDSGGGVNNALPRHLAHQRTRGGLLCDEPGLGKTVTVIAAVLATAGLTPHRKIWTAADDRLQQQVLVRRAWTSLDATDRRRMLQQLLNKLQRSTSHEAVAPFLTPVDGRVVDLSVYRSIVPTPMDLGTVQSGVSGGVCYAPPPVGRGIIGFVEDVRLTFENAMAFNASESHPVHIAAKALLDRFQCLMYGDQNALLPRLEAFAAQNPSDDDIVANRRKRRAILLPSAATLVVVPGPLLSHWREQLARHVDWSAVRFIPPTTSRALNSDAQGGSNFEQCVLIDDPKGRLCSRGAPRANDMASKLIVITTVERLSAEQRRMEREQEKFEQDMEREHGRSPTRRPSRRGGGRMPQQQRGRMAGENGLWAAERSPFQQIHWLRVVLDEGHVLGSCSLTSFNMLLDGIDAERTWAMTGTPTKDTSAGVALRNLFGLMRFLKHAPFGRVETRGIDVAGHLQPGGGRRAWNEIISEPYAAGCIAAEERLVQLLRGLMMRNTKADVPEIPKPLRRMVRLEMSDGEREAYNTRLAFIKTNIVLTQKPDGRIQDESLMHARNAADMARQMTFLRMLCVGGGAQLPSITEANRQEANAMMRSPCCSHSACIDKPRGSHHTEECPAWKHGLIGFNATEEARLRMDRFIGRAITAKLTLCGQCGIALSLQLVTPCGHFICPECMASAIRTRFTGRRSRAHRVGTQDKIIWDGTCAECGYAYTFDELQLLQPGFMVDWQERLLEASLERSWQGAAAQQAAASTASAAAAFGGVVSTNLTVVGPSSTVLESPVAAAGGSSNVNSTASSSLAGASNALGSHVHYVQGGAKSEHIIKRLRVVRAQQRAHTSGGAHVSASASTVTTTNELRAHVTANSASPFRPGIRPKPLTSRRRDIAAADDELPLQGCAPIKAIVFSQFRQPLNVVGHDLIMQFGQDAVAEFFGVYRSVELEKFRTNMLTVWRCPHCGHENQTVERTCQRPVALLRFQVEAPDAVQPGQPVQALAGEQTPAAGATFVDVKVPAEYIEGHFLGRSYRRGQTVEVARDVPSMGQGLQSFAGRSGRVQDMSKCRKKRAQTPEAHRRVDCFIMLLSNDGAVGLDLSFVTHIFLLDKIFNPALEKQVIARAHRMGATQPAVVEELLARGTVEELRAGISDDLHDDGSKVESEDEGLGKLMASARLLRMHEDSDSDSNCAAGGSRTGQQPSSKSRRVVTWGLGPSD